MTSENLAHGQIWKHDWGTCYIVTESQNRFVLTSLSDGSRWAGDMGFNGSQNCFSYVGMAETLRKEAVAEIDAIDFGADENHQNADKILLKFLEANGHKDVADAWRRCDKRSDGFWYS